MILQLPRPASQLSHMVHQEGALSRGTLSLSLVALDSWDAMSFPK